MNAAATKEIKPLWLQHQQEHSAQSSTADIQHSTKLAAAPPGRTVSLDHAPHQAPDRKYYKRQNFQSVPMEDYEIRDVLRRATTPVLHVELAFAQGSMASIEFAPQSEISKPIGIIVTVTNHSTQPAFHSLVKIGIDTALPFGGSRDLHQMGTSGDDQPQWWLGHRFSSPPDLPIFKEIAPAAGHRLTFLTTYPSSLLGGEHIFHLTTSVQTPGYSATEKWVIHQRGGTLRMCPPGHPLNR
jgi:hypothetical protein